MVDINLLGLLDVVGGNKRCNSAFGIPDQSVFVFPRRVGVVKL